MPFIQVKLNIKADETQKNDLQSKLTDAVANAFSKPKAFTMAEIQDNCSLYMAGNKMEKGAYISISLFGNTTKTACGILTQNICNILKNDFGIEGSNVYITYHPLDLWGWNGSMF